MDINLEYYRVFYYVAKYKKISLAAEKLYVSQPAVTQIIQKLEEQIGNNLFIRTKSGMELTEIGKTLFNFASNSIEVLNNVQYKFGKYENLEEGNIKIRTGSNVAKLFLYDAVEKFGKKYPNIKIQIESGATNKSVDSLEKGEIDMVCLHLPYNTKNDNLEIIECAEEEFVFVMSKNYKKNKKVKIEKIEDLNNYDLIIPNSESSIRKIFDNNFKDIIYNFHYEISQEQMKREFVLRDMGIAFMMRNEIEEEIKCGNVSEIKLKESQIKGKVGIIVFKKEMNSFAVQKLIEYIKG